MIQDYFKLAYRSVKQRKLRSWLTMLGIFVGIAAVVALITLSQGLQNAIASQFLKLGSDKLIVQAAGSGFGPPGTAVASPLTKKDKIAIDRTKDVDLAVGRLIRITQLEFKNEQKYTYAVSYPENSQEQDLVIEANDYQIQEGKFPEKNSPGVLIGYNLAHGFFEHDPILRDKILLQQKQFTIVGILKKSGNPQRDDTLVIPEESYRSLLGIKDDYDIIAIRIQKSADLASVADSLKKELRKSRNVEKSKEDFIIQTPQTLIATFNTILLIIEGVLIGIASISLLVGGVGIMNTMYTAVLERTKEIGLLKAIGATRREILILFLIESGMLGLLGGIIGVTLGILISKLVEFITYQIFESVLIHAEISSWLLLSALLFSFSVGIISGVLPAKQAAQLQVIDALRK